MSCIGALIKNPVVLSPDMTVHDALTKLDAHQIRCAPVVDANNHLVGMFGLHSLMEDLLPTAARIDMGVENLDFAVGAAPGAAKRMRKVAPNLLNTHMDKDFQTLSRDTSTLEAIRRLVKYGSPLAVIENDGKTFAGIVSEQSLLRMMYEILQDVEIEEKEIAAHLAAGQQ